MKKFKVKKRQPKQESAPLPSNDQNILTMEKGILSLLSFLGHSFRRGSITEEFYKNQQEAAVQKLDQLIVEDSQDGARDFDSNLKRDKLLKNKNDVESLLAFLEDSYNEGSVSEKSYRELKAENSKKLQRISILLRQNGHAGDEAEIGNGDPFKIPLQKDSNEDDSDEFDDAADSNSNAPQFREREFLQSPLPSIDIEPRVKPISFSQGNLEMPQTIESKKKLDSFRQNLEKMVSGKSSQEEKILDTIDEADDILRSLNINPKKATAINSPKETMADGYALSASQDANIGKERVMGALSSIVGKFKKPSQADAPKASAKQAASNQEPNPPLGGKPSWEDKLPEEMTPEELAQYNKVQEDRAKEASGETAAKEESSIAISQSSEGSGASASEIAKIVLEIEKMKVKVESTEGMRTVVEERIEHIM